MFQMMANGAARTLVKSQAVVAHVGLSPQARRRSFPLTLLVVALGAIVHPAVRATSPVFAAAPKASVTNATLPRNTADMRDAILAAVHSGKLVDLKAAIELNEMRPEIADERIDDAVAYFKSQSKDGEGRETLAVLDKILALPPAVVPFGRDIENNAIYVWPYLAERDLTKLTATEEADLSALIPADELAAVKSAKRWAWWRLAIGADGTWHSFRREK